MAIRTVARIPEPCACGAARIIITFDNGDTIIKHDDGSLIDYIGESDYQPSLLP